MTIPACHAVSRNSAGLLPRADNHPHAFVSRTIRLVKPASHIALRLVRLRLSAMASPGLLSFASLAGDAGMHGNLWRITVINPRAARSVGSRPVPPPQPRADAFTYIAPHTPTSRAFPPLACGPRHAATICPAPRTTPPRVPCSAAFLAGARAAEPAAQHCSSAACHHAQARRRACVPGPGRPRRASCSGCSDPASVVRERAAAITPPRSRAGGYPAQTTRHASRAAALASCAAA